jgi:isocitrate/isopropylmalate dehydrogenase
MKLNIALLAGDGIGPEVINEAVKVSDAIAKKLTPLEFLILMKLTKYA